MNTTSSTTYTLTDTSGSTLTVDSSGYLNVGSTITNGYIYTQPNYSFVEEGDKLVIRDQKGRECLALKDGKIYIGEKTLHQVILDVVDMVNGDKPITDLLVDPDQGKRELGKEIYERRARKTKSEQDKTQSDKE